MTELVDNLKDIVAHTFALGFVDLVKVTSTKSNTAIDAIADDKSVIVQANTLQPVGEFDGTFGMPNLSKLNIILGIPEYKENAKVQVVRRDKSDDKSPVCGIHFENKQGDFKNDYRFMGEELVNDKIKQIRLKAEPTWHITLVPSLAAIQKFKYQAQANSEETVFTVSVKDNNLQLNFGDHSSHAGSFVFATGVTGKLTHTWAFPVARVLSILSLSGDKTMKFSNDGLCAIVVNSGISEYNYLLPAMQK
jgi:hypothetical protein